MYSSMKNTNRYKITPNSNLAHNFADHEQSSFPRQNYNPNHHIDLKNDIQMTEFSELETNETEDQSLMIHIVPESNRSRWHHINDLDSFFSRVYTYHQKNGFKPMMLQEILELFQFIFVLCLCSFLFHGVDYQILFRDKLVNSTSPMQKVIFSDAIYPIDKFLNSFGKTTWFLLIIALIFWTCRLVKVIFHFFHFWDIRMFYKEALRIDDNSLSDMTWYDVQNKLKEVQKEQMMCIHKHDLTDLDIYHRILRFRNYLIAMVNKNVFPLKIRIPFLGEIPVVTQSLIYNLEFILFWGPYSPFENTWRLREEYKMSLKRLELSDNLSKQIFWVALVNFCLSYLITLWQFLYFLFNYADVVKREPSFLGSRRWSLYSRLYLRHFNELDHELNVRLNQAYRPATKYFGIFTSPLLIILAKNICFFCGSILFVLIALTVYDEDVLAVEHVLTIITLFGIIVAIGRSMIPDENIVWCPESLMRQVLAYVHYLPESWRGLSHTSKVREEFGQLFQYTASYLLLESLSGFLTPFMLIFYIRPRALDIVDFFRNSTTSIVGVGDVCSFAQLDVKTHGDIRWQFSDDDQKCGINEDIEVDLRTENGKIELSLLHFVNTNPKWEAPQESREFINKLNQRLQLMSMKNGINSIAYTNYSSNNENDIYLQKNDTNINSVIYQPFVFNEEKNDTEDMQNSVILKGPLNKVSGPLIDKKIGISLGASLFGTNSESYVDQSVNMNMSTLFLHDYHQKRIKNYSESINESKQSKPSTSKDSTNLSEKTPLLSYSTTNY